ncbi:MAG: NAD-dependent epimerase/dehydratase family protein [Patescibacteria group bacterium]
MPITPIFEKKNVLVTGGAGFIGSHLCEVLLEEAKVICMDNLLSGTVSNIDHLLKYPDFVFIKHDVSEPFDLTTFPELEKFKVQFQGVQEIYHLACPTSPKDFDKYKIETLKASSHGTKNVLDAALKYKARVLFASSSVVYGPRQEGERFVEEAIQGAFDHLSPRGCYDEGKRFAETMMATYRDFHGLDTRIARIFRTYGPRVRLNIGEMLPDFIVSALDMKDLVIYGDESFRTSLCHINDLVDGLLKLMAHPTDLGPVNFGSDEDLSLADVARQIIEMTGSKSKITFQPALLFMTQLSLPNIAKAKESLGWFPLVRLKDGLKQTIDWTIANRSLLGEK